MIGAGTVCKYGYYGTGVAFRTEREQDIGLFAYLEVAVGDSVPPVS